MLDTPLGTRLRKASPRVKQLIADAGGSNVRVFGSVATGREHSKSDVDLIFTMNKPLSLMALGKLEQLIADEVGAPVDLVPDTSLRPAFRDRILNEAVPL
ncbi:nucleotidyltransferase family protein [Gulosibacter molinativorax]|uniref:DNA polymerase subunit beta n=1 Tax=Gulosibacter molinativorax TaxID=256821 RepID=A0ABT7C9Q4_9MICO|nr:nucleotidyltransferase domain-containing protein [Gulosibacter molinativorax]MDJ1371890.1 DNA polymerase subunit beta [Gulosibacter molinativorax]QUY62537.1 Toxin-antitoxin system toxin subunit [Gulosibacter molinativorax]